MNAANIENWQLYKTLSKTTTQMFQPRNMLKCQIVLKKNLNLININLKIGFFFEIA